MSKVCRIDGCDRIPTKGYVCNTHVSRKTRTGSYNGSLPRTYNYIRNAMKGKFSYTAIHNRLHRIMGSASRHPCAMCGGKARTWSYIKGSYFERLGETTRGHKAPYSPRMVDYEPLCDSCHTKKDKSEGIPTTIVEGFGF